MIMKFQDVSGELLRDDLERDKKCMCWIRLHCSNLGERKIYEDFLRVSYKMVMKIL